MIGKTINKCQALLTRVGDGEVDGDVSPVLVHLVIKTEVATDPPAVPLGAWTQHNNWW